MKSSGWNSTTYFGGFYNTLAASSDTRNVMPGGNATLGRLQSNTFSDTSNYGVRAREELKLTPNLTAVAGIGWETTHLKGINTVYNYNTSPMSERPTITPIDRRPAIPEHRARTGAALQAESPSGSSAARVATGYGTPQVGNLFVLSNGQNGNNTQLKTQKNLGYDLGLRLDAEQRAEIQRDRLLRILQERTGHRRRRQVGAPNASFTFNAPRSEHRGVELAADWKFYPGWRFTAAYTYLDEFYTEYTENLINGATSSASTVPATRSPASRRTN